MDREPGRAFLAEVAYYHMHTPFTGSATTFARNRDESYAAGLTNYNGTLEEPVDPPDEA